MYKLIASLFITLIITSNAQAAAQSDCRSLLLNFIHKADRNEMSAQIHIGWKEKETKKFLEDVRKMGFGFEDQRIIGQALVTADKTLTPERVKEYLKFVLVLSEKDQKRALKDIVYLDSKIANRSKHVERFAKYEKKIKTKIAKASKWTPAEQERYRELYYGCRALRPNGVNANAARDFKRFNLSLGLGTLSASYAFYNMDKEKDAMWYGKLAYDLGVTIMFSYVGSAIQTKPTDTQVTKSIKNYMSGRILGGTDIVIYDPIFNTERKQAEARFENLKKDPEFKKKVDRLLAEYKKRGVYRKFKDALMARLKMLPSLSIGMEGHSIDNISGVDWNNITREDLEREDVQEVLVQAAMAQIYQESTGEWIETSNIGLDRYAFNSVYYGVTIPKSIIQNYITYQMLCMGQDKPKAAFTKAILFNVAASFLTNQALFGFREKAINQ